MAPAPEKSGARLSRSQRLTRRSEFDEVMKSGVRSRDECFNVYALATTLPHARLGITVARRVSTKAVSRNRIKRQIRESFRQTQPLLGSASVVVTAQPLSDKRNNTELRASLGKHWQRLLKQTRSR